MKLEIDENLSKLCPIEENATQKLEENFNKLEIQNSTGNKLDESTEKEFTVLKQDDVASPTFGVTDSVSEVQNSMEKKLDEGRETEFNVVKQDEVASPTFGVKDSVSEIQNSMEKKFDENIERDLNALKQDDVVSPTVGVTELVSEIPDVKKVEGIVEHVPQSNLKQLTVKSKPAISANMPTAKKSLTEVKKNATATKTTSVLTQKTRASPALGAKASSSVDKKLGKPMPKTNTISATDSKPTNKSSIGSRPVSASTAMGTKSNSKPLATTRTTASAPVRKPAVPSFTMLKARGTSSTVSTATNGQTKPTTLGVSSSIAAKSISPKSTLTSQLRKNAGTNNLTTKPKSPLKSVSNVISKTTVSTTTTRTKTTTVSAVSGSVNNVTKPFVARPAPKFISNSVTNTSSTKRLGLGNNASGTTTKPVGSQLRKSSPTKTVANKTLVKSSVSGNVNPKTGNTTAKLVKKPEMNKSNGNIEIETEKAKPNGINDNPNDESNDFAVPTDNAEVKDSKEVLLDI